MNPVILNQSDGSWVFEDMAQTLSRSLWLDISETPGSFNYILGSDSDIFAPDIESFIPIDSIRIAADKRAIEDRFKVYEVARPKTFIVDSLAQISEILRIYPHQRWILKYPTGCGGMNHRIIESIDEIPANWPQPFLIQEFIKSDRPAVYRVYCVAGDLFGFNARKFADSEVTCPWVSHANGASYNYDESAPAAAIPHRGGCANEIAKAALISTGLYDSFGVVDLVKNDRQQWFALEVGTDGIYNHVDRDIDNPNLTDELNRRLAIAFWQRVGTTPPWGKNWHYRD